MEKNHPGSKNGKIKASPRETAMEIENLGKRSEGIRTIITTRIQEKEEKISGAEDTIGNIDYTVKENAKCKKHLIQNIQKIQDKMRRPKLKIIGIEESKYCQLKGPVNIFSKIMEENFPNIKMPMNIQEAYRTPNRFEHKRNSSCHIIIKNTKCTKQRKAIKRSKEKRPRNIERLTNQNYSRL